MINKSGTIFSLSTNNGLLSFLFEVQSTPQIIDQIIDSQRIVDNKIKNLCELFINHSVGLILKRLQLVRNQLVNCSKIINNESKSTGGGDSSTTTTKFDSDENSSNVNANNSNNLSIDISSGDGCGQSTSEENKIKEENIHLESIDQTKIETIAEQQTNSDLKVTTELQPNNQTNETQQHNREQLNSTDSTSMTTTSKDQQSSTNQSIVNIKQSKNEEQLNGVEQLVKDLNELISEANEQVISIQKSMKIYLSSEDTEAILFKPIKNQIVKSIETLFGQLAILFSDQEQRLFDECQFQTAKSALESIFNNRRGI